MSKVNTDIDIDFVDRDSALVGLHSISAVMTQRDQVIKHPSGVYFQDIPINPITGYAAFEYEQASELGYFKIDFLNNSIYTGIRDDDHLTELVNREPDWEIFEIEEIVAKLAHIHSSFGLVSIIKPKNIEDLATILALMRPGKRHLIGSPRDFIEQEIWKTSDEFSFKKSHAIAYATSIIVQLNLICDQITDVDETPDIFRD